MTRRMDYTIAFDAPAEKIYQDFASREYWQNPDGRLSLPDAAVGDHLVLVHHIRLLFDAEEAFTADWISKHQ